MQWTSDNELHYSGYLFNMQNVLYAMVIKTGNVQAWYHYDCLGLSNCMQHVTSVVTQLQGLNKIHVCTIKFCITLPLTLSYTLCTAICSDIFEPHFQIKINLFELSSYKMSLPFWSSCNDMWRSHNAASFCTPRNVDHNHWMQWCITVNAYSNRRKCQTGRIISLQCSNYNFKLQRDFWVSFVQFQSCILFLVHLGHHEITIWQEEHHSSCCT